MLMGNAAKILQTVASNIDNDIIEPVVSELYDMVMLTDTTGILSGDESIDVLGVNVAMQRETQRQRQLEFLQITANPIDMQIMGPRGRANVLRPVADGIGLDGETIVPPDEEIKAHAPGGCPAALHQADPAATRWRPAGARRRTAGAPQGPQTNVSRRDAGCRPWYRRQSSARTGVMASKTCMVHPDLWDAKKVSYPGKVKTFAEGWRGQATTTSTRRASRPAAAA